MRRPRHAPSVIVLALGAALALHAHAGGGLLPHNPVPRFISGPIHVQHYDGVSDDLLTAGLGKSGIMAVTAPPFADPLAPTPAELRRNAIHTNYRALVDWTEAGGFGVLYGPNIDPEGHDTLGEGKVAGTEYIAFANDGRRLENVTLMVQVPESFDPVDPCIVTGTSSGSRGIYGAIGTAGEWGLKRGCAVAYTDKGTGNGLHDLMTDQVNRIDGVFTDAPASEAIFRADLSFDQLAAFNAAYPDRVAYKHAHSQLNPEQHWGRDTLNAIRFAFHVLNAHHAPAAGPAKGARRLAIRSDNTIVIASSVSNGGGAAIAAAEQDFWGLIDGVAVSEPNVQPRDTRRLTIRQGDATVETHGRPLADYTTYANLYQPCAILSPAAGLSLDAAFWPDAFTASSEARCQQLHARGLLDASTLAGQAEEALARLHAYGWQPEQAFLHQSQFRFVTNSIVTTYVNAYGRFSVTDNVCGYSFANTNAAGEVIPQNPAAQAGIFSTGNGIPPTTGVGIVYNDSVGGPRLDLLAVSPTSGMSDFAFDGALCMRALVTGRDEVTGAKLTGAMGAMSHRVRMGLHQTLRSARLRGTPTVIATGRNDNVLPVNHASRAYVGQNLINEGSRANTRYYEVTNAQHLDASIALGTLLGYDTRFIPLHYYFGQALDAMYDHLKHGDPLPPSQVVRTTPRGPAESISAANVPPISHSPDAGDLIRFSDNTLEIPD